jgi:hypothetical protein
MIPIHKPASNLDHAWRWRDRKGTFTAPKDMETRHLFYTVRMIWNHVVPMEMQVGHGIKLYRFPDFYTGDYMRRAARQMLPELNGRRDIQKWMQRELNQMAAWFPAEFSEVSAIAAPVKLLTAIQTAD